MAEESPLLQSAVAAWSRRKDPSVFAAEDTRMRHTSIYVASLGGRARLISKVHLVIFGRPKSMCCLSHKDMLESLRSVARNDCKQKISQVLSDLFKAATGRCVEAAFQIKLRR